MRAQQDEHEHLERTKRVNTSKALDLKMFIFLMVEMMGAGGGIR